MPSFPLQSSLILMFQTYQEEMLEKSPRREFLNKYADQLLVRYPNLVDQVNLRLQRLNSQWQAVEAAISPTKNALQAGHMLQGEILLLVF